MTLNADQTSLNATETHHDSAPPRGGFDESRTLIDDLLAEQQRLTAVEKFSQRHDRHELAPNARRYRDLIPLSLPRTGQQFAFEVDLDKCSGCKACVTACHSLNGLDDGEVWRDVGLLISDDWRRPFQQTITTACHHCVDPGCLNGCPVLAYEKDSVTGIVRHLDDQCIGCQYCVLKCPYDVPKYLPARGIVRKCDMCSQRLLAGEAPACVQACPSEAIRITVVEQAKVQSEFRSSRSKETLACKSEARNPKSERSPKSETRNSDFGFWNSFGLRFSEFGSNSFLPASPDPAITLPTTRYVSKQRLPADLIPADAAEVQLQPAHWPLVWMLTLTQLSVGVFALLPFVDQPAQPPLALSALIAGLTGLAASVLHLGKPLKAWRAFLGLRKSWLSRELVAFAGFIPLAAALTMALWFSSESFSLARSPTYSLTVLTGLLGVFCSAMTYHDTPRVFWHGWRSVGRFFGTTAVLGLAAAWVRAEASGVLAPWLAVALGVAATVKLAGEHRLLRPAAEDIAEQTWPKPGQETAWSLARSAVLMRDRLGLITRLRFFFGAIGGVCLPWVSLISADQAVVLALLAFGLCLLTELAERYLFFRAVVPPRMPGNV